MSSPVAALDIGSNTVLMLVARGDAQGIQILAEEIRFPRLGRGVDKTGRLDPAARREALEALKTLAAQARALGAERIEGVGTSALRDACDGPDFVQQALEVSGAKIEIISGPQEAQLSWRAATAGQPDQNTLVIDIGGNSTELIAGVGEQLTAKVSLDIGAVRLTERFLATDPPTPKELDRLEDFLSQTLKSAQLPASDHVVAVAGTATTLASLLQGLQAYEPERIQGYQPRLSDLETLFASLAAESAAQRAQRPCLPPRRADVIIAGAGILIATLRSLGADQVEVCDRGLRHAVLWRLLGLEGPPPRQQVVA